MSGAQSIATRRAYGVQRVCRVWHRARSSVYARRQATRSPARCRRRGPIGAAPDDVLVAHLRRVLEASPFHGEGYRKAWAKLRVAGMRRPYPAMNDSGVPWVGEVPTYWEVRRLKSWLDVNEFVLSEDTDPEYTFEYLDIGSVATGRLTAKPERIRFGNSPSRARRVVRPGDTIVSTVRTYLKAVWHAEHPGDDLVASTGFAVLTPRRGAFPRFVSYFCQSDPFTNRVTAEAVGIAYPAIAETRLGTFEVCIPPYPEQAAIVRFLDHADRRIRRYIRAKQQLIALLEEQKQAVIHQAVTRGLDPNVRLKPSGVEWLGDVPEHWEVRRLKWVTRLQRGYDLPADRRVPGSFPVVSSGGFIGTHSESRCAGPGVVMGRYGSTEAVFYVEQDFWPHNTSLFVTHFQGNTQKWCYYLLRSITKADHAGKSAVPGLDRNDLFQIVVPVPPVNEQREVVRMIEVATHDLNDAIAAARREIDLLREYRTRLIADVVTGKLDVREAAARLPDEVEEPKPLDETDALTDGEDEPSDDLDAVAAGAEV